MRRVRRSGTGVGPARGPRRLSETDAVSASEVEELTATLRAQTKLAVGQRLRLTTQEIAAELLPPSELKCLAGQCLAVIGTKLQANAPPSTEDPSLRLAAGGHELVIRDDCFERSGTRLSLKAGEKRTVKLAAQPVYGAVRFRMEDAR